MGSRRKILHVVGARPNFMKIAPVMRAVERAGFAEQRLVHTGQHYDVSMSDVFFDHAIGPVLGQYMAAGRGRNALLDVPSDMTFRRSAGV